MPGPKKEIRKELRQRTTKLRYIKVESTSINKTAPLRTIKESFIGNQTVENGTERRQKFLIRKRHRSFGGVSGEKEKMPNGLKNLNRDFEHKEEQEEVEISLKNIKKILRPNWKVPGRDFVQGSWLKMFKNVFKKDLEETCKSA